MNWGMLSEKRVESAGSARRWVLAPVVAVTGLAAGVLAPLGVGVASASGGNVSPGTVTLASSVAGASTTYTIPFTTSSTGALSSGSTISFVAPIGTAFSNAVSNYSHSSVPISSVSVSKGSGSTTNNQVQLTLGTGASVGNSSLVTTEADFTSNPITASQTDSIAESTSVDNATPPANSPSYAITPGPVATGTASSSSDGQHATTSTAFANPLSATFYDNYGNTVPGKLVVFTAPQSGASGTFASCPNNPSGTSANQCYVTTNSSGVATSSTFTANGTAGTYQVTAAAPTGSAAVFNLTNTQPTATALIPGAVTLSKTGGGAANIVGETGVTYAMPFTTSGSGQLTSGGTITMVAPEGTILPASCTGSGTSCGNYTVSLGGVGPEAIASVAASPATGSTTNNKIVITLGTLAVIPSGGSVTVTATGVTNPTLAKVNDFVTESTSRDTAAVSSPDYVIAPGPAVKVDPGTGGQATTVGMTFANPLVATVVDQYNNPVGAGTEVTFTAGPSGFDSCPNTTALACFANTTNVETDTTGSDGSVTTSQLTANHVSGTYTVTAVDSSVSGVAPATFTLTNNVGPVATIQVTGGAGQHATVGSAFASPLAVTLTDGYGNVVPNATVTFAAPSSGASGTFASCGTGGNPQPYECVVTSKSSGVATSSTFTASKTAGSYNVSATSGAATTNIGLTNDPGSPAVIDITSSTNNQNATVGLPFASPLQLVVRDADNNPIPNETVTFAAPSSGASGTFASCGTGGNPQPYECIVSTNSSGVATSSTFTANTTAGTYNVSATTADPATANFTLTNNPDQAVGLKAVAATPQSGEIDQPYATNLQVQVVDQYQNAVKDSGLMVTFSAPSSGASGTFAACPGGNSPPYECAVTTDSNGLATASTFTANATTGAFHVTATPSGQAGVTGTTTFDLTNAGSPSAMHLVQGTPQTVSVGSTFPTRLEVRVVDASGTGVPNVSVTFTAPMSGASAMFTTTGSNVEVDKTDNNGYATASALIANTVAGAYHVTATAGAFSVTFALTNTHGAADFLTPIGGTPQTANVNAPFGSPLKAEVVDLFGNPITGVSVTFSAPSSGASGRFSRTGGATENDVTNSSGVATSSTFTANASAGGYKVNVTGAGLNASFSLTNVQGYWMVASDGGIFSFGARFYGSMGGKPLAAPIVGMTSAPRGNGYWFVATDGGIFAFGPGAAYHGSMGGKPLAKPIVAMAVDPVTGGYWLVASDGGIFAFDAPYYGSMGGKPLTQPIVGMAAAPHGNGYWLVARDGGIFAFGPGAAYHGSMGGKPLVKPIVGMAVDPATGGYWLVASDGGLFAFDARYFGSTGGLPLAQPIVGMTATDDGNGYWLVASDGGLFTYGDAEYLGSMGGIPLTKPIVGMASS